MAIYHLCAQVISRASNRSSVAAAAYRAGEAIEDRRLEVMHDYTDKTGIAHKEILAPVGVPAWMQNRTELWNQVEAFEKRCDLISKQFISTDCPWYNEDDRCDER